MRILIIDNGSQYTTKLERIFYGHTVTLIRYEVFKPHFLNNFDLVILTGGEHQYPVQHVYDTYEDQLRTILRSPLPLLGICLGFELIVHAFGGTLTQLPEKERGILDISPITEDPLFKDVHQLHVFESHRWVADKLPLQLIPLAESKDGIEIIRHVTRFIYGFQFHPELIVSQDGITLLHNFLKLVYDQREKHNSSPAYHVFRSNLSPSPSR